MNALQIYETLRWASILNGITCFLIAALAGIFFGGGTFLIKSGIKETMPNTRKWMTTFGISLSLVSLVIFCIFFWLGLTRVANPDMHAIDYLFRHSQSGSLGLFR